MQVDRSTRILLLLLVIGVWGLLLKPLFEPVPVRAQGNQIITLQGSPTFTIRLDSPLNINLSGRGDGPITIRREP